jgi:hypothetical protein
MMDFEYSPLKNIWQEFKPVAVYVKNVTLSTFGTASNFKRKSKVMI